MSSTVTAPVSDGSQLSANAKPFIPCNNPNQGSASVMSMSGSEVQGGQNVATNSAMAYNGYSMAENNAEGMEGYLKDLQAEHAKLSGLVKTVELNHVLRLVELEMKKVVLSLKKQGISVSDLPAPKGPVVTLTEKLIIPVDQYPGYNFVGRILGPRGMSVKQLEQGTGCKIKITGREKESSEQNNTHTEQGENTTEAEKPYVVVSCQDTENRATLKLKRAVDELQHILNPTKPNGDELKRKQLMELAIINGSYRPPNFNILKNAQQMQQPLSAMHQPPFQGYQVHAAPAVY